MENLFLLPVRVYYEDTDAGGVVYHARYLHFFERARTEYLRTIHFSQQILLEQKRLAFVVKSMTIEYNTPAKLDDYLTVETEISALRGATLIFNQRLVRNALILSEATVKVACVDLDKMKPTAIPHEIKAAFSTIS